ncbi:unnamed protein product [Brassicogethes aeneus]|uniref:Uncharacterized protein n=1 Tax=Brassicogethes aeneus TaxID=1431903 RepID=A0A9P0FIK7_BRAAE|nr:unnamed protein product [Brassicogethes aeneus]
MASIERGNFRIRKPNHLRKIPPANCETKENPASSSIQTKDTKLNEDTENHASKSTKNTEPTEYKENPLVAQNCPTQNTPGIKKIMPPRFHLYSPGPESDHRNPTKKDKNEPILPLSTNWTRAEQMYGVGGGENHSNECVKPKTDPPTCANCAKGHPANYRGFKKYPNPKPKKAQTKRSQSVQNWRNADSLTIPNYETYNTNRTRREGGGTAIFIRRNLEHHQSYIPPLDDLEANSIIVRISHLGNLRLVSAYHPPQRATTIPANAQQLETAIVDLQEVITSSLQESTNETRYPER